MTLVRLLRSPVDTHNNVRSQDEKGSYLVRTAGASGHQSDQKPTTSCVLIILPNSQHFKTPLTSVYLIYLKETTQYAKRGFHSVLSTSCSYCPEVECMVDQWEHWIIQQDHGVYQKSFCYFWYGFFSFLCSSAFQRCAALDRILLW